MIQTDFYSGEPVITGSPPLFQGENIINTDPNTAEAASMASFGKYDYDPSTRMQQGAIYPGAYGYTPYQQPIGIGAPPMYGYGYSPYGNPMPTYGMYRPYPQQPYYQQQQVQQPTTVHIPGVNLSGEYMPPADWERQITDMQSEYWTKQQEMEAKQSVDRQSSVYGYGYGYGGMNYYGTPYFNPYQYNSLNTEFSQRINAIKDEARENRLQFDLQIARLAHNFSKQPISEEDLRQRYEGRDIDIPQVFQITPQEFYEQSRLINAVPFDNSQEYRDHRAAVQREFHKIIPEDADLKTTFDSMGIIAANWEMEEEMHRRRNAGNLYNSGDNSYKYFVRKKAQERYAKEKGIVLPGSMPSFNSQDIKQSIINSSPILSQTAHLADDGTLNVSLNIPCNVGSRAGQTYTVHNSQEAEYDEKRERFKAFLDEIPDSISLNEIKRKKLEEYNYG